MVKCPHCQGNMLDEISWKVDKEGKIYIEKYYCNGCSKEIKAEEIKDNGNN